MALPCEITRIRVIYISLPQTGTQGNQEHVVIVQKCSRDPQRDVIMRSVVHDCALQYVELYRMMTKKSKFPQLPSPHGRNNLESTTSGYDKLSGTSLKPHSASTSKSSSKFKRDDSLENQTSVNVKKETQDHLASFYGDKLHSRDLMPDSHHLADLHSALAAYKQSNFRSMSLSPFNLGAAMDFNKSPSRTSSGQRDDQESVSNDEMPNTNGSDIENFETLRQSIENDDLKFDEMNKRMKRESPSSEAGMMGNINENGKSEQNNNGEN